MTRSKEDGTYNAYQDDGLPDFDACVRLVEGFWRLVAEDLAIGDLDAKTWLEGECLPEFCAHPPCDGLDLWVNLSTKELNPSDIANFLLDEFWLKPQSLYRFRKTKHARFLMQSLGQQAE